MHVTISESSHIIFGPASHFPPLIRIWNAVAADLPRLLEHPSLQTNLQILLWDPDVFPSQMGSL